MTKNTCLRRFVRDAALITADEAHGISITGEGVIDGNGMSFVEELPKEKCR